MKVKDLRDYLSLHDISTEMCREKEELVFLVLGQQPVISEADRTRVPPLPQAFAEQQAFLTQPQTSTVPPTSPGLPSSPAQVTSVPLAQDQETQQVGTSMQPHPYVCSGILCPPPLHCGNGVSSIMYNGVKPICLLILEVVFSDHLDSSSGSRDGRPSTMFLYGLVVIPSSPN